LQRFNLEAWQHFLDRSRTIVGAQSEVLPKNHDLDALKV
jgi:hypothetical protein